ncbi:MAG: hypothetical protein ABSD57_07465 [Verrucomicrobiota bacterium]|jgi:hypothetical protein
MNKLLTISFWAVMAVAMAAKASPPDLIARIHFVGVEQISADTNSAAFTNFFCSAEAQVLREQTLNKLSHFPYAWFRSRIVAGTNDGADQLRPLLDDLLKSEWFLEIRDTTNGAPETALAIRLNPDRAQLWQENLAGVLQSWTRLPAVKTSNGWLLKKDLPPNLIRFVRAGAWVVLSCGENKLPLSDGIVRRVLAEKRPAPFGKNYWLRVDADWPRLARWFLPLKGFDFPKIELQFIGRDGNLQSSGRFTLAQPLPPLGKWRIPTNTIYQPFVSFTMARGIGAWLERQNWAQPYEIQPPPDQFFIWALPQNPFQTFAAVPVPDAAAALAQLNARLSAAFNTNLHNFFYPPITTELTNNEISWRGVPFIAPYVKPLHEPAGDFLFGGFFPGTGRSRSLSPELLKQLNAPNLVYYHWETTADRLKELPQLTQLLLLIAQHKQLDGNSTAAKWLDHVEPTLGPSVTEITQTGPNELAFTRTASDGLTAVELIALANWLDAPNFPGCDLRLPPRPLTPRRPLKLGTPASPAPASPALPH